MPEAAYAPSLRKLNDPEALQPVIAAFEFLDSLRLHYCINCDEEWPVFDAQWPQTGVAWVGPKDDRARRLSGVGQGSPALQPLRCPNSLPEDVLRGEPAASWHTPSSAVGSYLV